MNTPPETLKAIVNSGIAKADAPLRKLAVFGLLAGIFIALAAAASNMAAMNLLANPETYGLGRLVAGAVFAGGLICVVIAGAELFTGNILMIVALLSRKITSDKLIRNWVVVILFNVIGGMLVAYLVALTGLFHQNANLYGAITIKIAAGKTALDFIPALVSGILCNLLVCLAVWMAAAAKSVAGKITAIFFPILLFVVMGFEHSIANAFCIPAGLLAALDPVLVPAAENIGANLTSLTPFGFVTNLAPVILGNIIGGGLFVATAYYVALSKK